MRTEKEVKKELENFTNQMKNSAMMYESTGQERFKEISINSLIIVDVLNWVLGKKDEIGEEEVEFVNTEDINP